MAIIKDNLTHTNNYLFDSNLTMSAKELLTMLININDDYNITMEELCNLTKNGPDAVKSTLTELMNKNYLKELKLGIKKVIIYTSMFCMIITITNNSKLKIYKYKKVNLHKKKFVL